MSWESIIDQMKEWVLSLAYATQVWVTAQIAILKLWVQNEGFATQVWVGSQNYLTASYVDRGDPANYDFDSTDFVFDGAWHVKDLSAIVPATAQAVDIFVMARTAAIGKQFMMRKTGNVNGNVLSGLITQVANVWQQTLFTVALDGNQSIEYLIQAPSWMGVIVTVKGWWL